MVLEYKMFEIEEVNGLFENKPYNIVYMNYEKEKGIEKVVNKESAWKELKNNNLNDFYKLYLFNDDRMITVYSRPDCMPCKFTKQFLTEHNIPFKNVDVSEEPEALEILKQHGFFTLPVVAINQSFDFAFCGFQPDKLNDLLK